MLRDEVWDQALQLLAEGEVVSLLKLEFSSSQLVSAKRTLRDMEKLGWLTKRSDDPPVWGAGPVAQRCLNLYKPIRPTGDGLLIARQQPNKIFDVPYFGRRAN